MEAQSPHPLEISLVIALLLPPLSSHKSKCRLPENAFFFWVPLLPRLLAYNALLLHGHELLEKP